MLLEKITKTRQELEELAPKHETDAERQAYFIDLVSKLCRCFENLSTGVFLPEDDTFAVASRAHGYFDGFKRKLLEATPDFLDNDYHEKLEIMVSKTRGSALSNFLSHPVFAKCFREEYHTPLKGILYELVEEIEEMTSSVLEQLVKTGLDGERDCGLETAPDSLKEAVLAEVQEFVASQKADCLKHINISYASEEFIFTMDESYGRSIVKLKSHKMPHKPDEGNDNDNDDDSVKKEPQVLSMSAVERFKTTFTRLMDAFMNGSNEDKAICELQASLDSYIKIRYSFKFNRD